MAQAPPAVAPVTPPVTPAPEPPATEMAPLQQRLAQYLEHQDGTYGVHVIDVASGRTAGINQDLTFPAASTFKLPMALYILDQVARGEADLDERLAYSLGDYEEGTGVLQETVQEGDTLPVRELISLAITESDNVATNMLLHRFSRDSIHAYMLKMGATVLLDGNENATTPREMADFMWLAYSAKAISDPVLRRFLMDSLASTAFHERVAAGVPAGVTVAHKIGTLPGVVNDVALVYAPTRTFVLSVFSSGVSEDVAPDVIAEITRMVYQFETSSALVHSVPPPTENQSSRN